MRPEPIASGVGSRKQIERTDVYPNTQTICLFPHRSASLGIAHPQTPTSEPVCKVTLSQDTKVRGVLVKQLCRIVVSKILTMTAE
jgi:hypothetical protein